MKKLLVVIPSRGRPHRITDTLKSIEDTTDAFYTDVVVLLDKDDPTLGQYEEILPDWVMKRVYDREGDKTLTTEIINRVFEELNDYEFYSVTNDDIVYKTKGWDVALSNPLKISSGQDDTMVEKYGFKRVGNVDPGEFPITSVICGDIARSIGWLQLPKLRHSCGDNIWFWIGKRTNTLHHDNRYHTDHNSPYFDRAEVDKTFEMSNAHENMGDYYIYKEWLKYRCSDEINAVFHLLSKNGGEKCQEAYQEV